MRSEDRLQFAQLMTGISEIHGKALSKAAMALWWASLEPHSLEDVKRALGAHTRDSERGRFMPTPADVIRHIDGSAEDRAMVAWDKVHGAIRRVGQYVNVAFDDPIIHCVVEAMGGWVKLAEIETDRVPFVSRDFIARYKHYTAHPPAHYPKLLSGAGGDGKIALIGDREAAKLVYERGITQRPATVQAIADLTQKALGRAA